MTPAPPQCDAGRTTPLYFQIRICHILARQVKNTKYIQTRTGDNRINRHHQRLTAWCMVLSTSKVIAWTGDPSIPSSKMDSPAVHARGPSGVSPISVCQDKTLEGWRPRRYACQKSTWLQFLMFLCLTCRAAAQSARESVAMYCTWLQHVAIQNLRIGHRLNSSLISGEPSIAPKSQAYRKAKCRATSWRRDTK